ncbi:hypothetical protein [Streptomyces fumanus]|uniref:Uncharacterized protein n=1 Tax=Streptomyces fumanus TaxID=67302 RepID=A0A919A9H1_9ACTN|nr:hypothetical protein [Streptomyces fumanus]GHE93173.1 hypothetical protein GCM10018772_16180 [Streptomyces fumanus]
MPNATPAQMVEMQRKLDQDRAQLPHIRQRVRDRLRNRPEERTNFTAAIDRLIELDAFEQRGIGWAKGNPEGDQRFRELRAGQKTDRETVLEILRNAEGRARSSRDRESLSADRRLLKSIPKQEKELYRARREYARSITEDTMEAVPFASNQISDIANSGGQSYDALEVLFNEDIRVPTADMPTWLGQTAVLAAHAKAGACDDQSAYAFTEANMRLEGTQVTRADLEPGHAMVIIGPPNRPESAHIDTWPLQARVTNPQTYGLDNIQTGSVTYSQIADGRDLRREAMETLRHPLPDAPPLRDPISLDAAMERMRLEGVGEETYHITSTSTVPNSDSDSDDVTQGYGHPLSPAAFTAHLDNGFQIQPESAIQSPTSAAYSSDSSADTHHPSDEQYGASASDFSAASYPGTASYPATASYAGTASYAPNPYGTSSATTSWGTGHIQFTPSYGLQDVRYAQYAQSYGPTDQPGPAAMNPVGSQGAGSYNPSGPLQGAVGTRGHHGPSGSQWPQQQSGQRRRR